MTVYIIVFLCLILLSIPHVMFFINLCCTYHNVPDGIGCIAVPNPLWDKHSSLECLFNIVHVKAAGHGFQFLVRWIIQPLHLLEAQLPLLEAWLHFLETRLPFLETQFPFLETWLTFLEAHHILLKVCLPLLDGCLPLPEACLPFLESHLPHFEVLLHLEVGLPIISRHRDLGK